MDANQNIFDPSYVIRDAAPRVRLYEIAPETEQEVGPPNLYLTPGVATYRFPGRRIRQSDLVPKEWLRQVYRDGAIEHSQDLMRNTMIFRPWNPLVPSGDVTDKYKEVCYAVCEILTGAGAYRHHKQVLFSKLHGLAHWHRVIYYGVHLWHRDPVIGNDHTLEGIMIFALLHDAFRINEFEDENHGERAATWVHENQGLVADMIGHDYGIVTALKIALALHNKGRVVPPEVFDHNASFGSLGHSLARFVAICWDADRLDLFRGASPIHPSPSLLSHPLSRENLYAL